MCISALNIFAVLSCSTGSKPSLLPGKAEGTHVWDQQPIYMATDTLKQGQCWCRAHQRHAYKYLHALEGGHMESTPFRLMTLLLHFLAHRFAKEARRNLLPLELPETCLAMGRPEEAATSAISGHRMAIEGHWGYPDAHSLVV